MKPYVNRCKMLLELLKNRIYGEDNIIPVTELYRKRIDYDQRGTIYETVLEKGWEKFDNGSSWGGHDIHDCFKTYITIPQEMGGKEIWLQVSTGANDIWNTDNPQFLFYLNQELVCGMDMNHYEVCLSKNAKSGEQLELGLYAYSNSHEKTDHLNLKIREKHSDVEALYYDFKVLFELAMELREDDLRRIEIISDLNQVVSLLELRNHKLDEFYKSVGKAREYLHNKYKHEHKDTYNQEKVIVHSIGHTHIDLAWKWPIRQTREKVLRSFSTVLNLMKEYPEYRFMSSQPQLYQFVKEEEPQLFEEIKKRVQEGRWEVEGSMWVEPDCNLTSGESLIRQIVYGKRFFEEEFAKGDNVVLWLPDVFGYSAAMPQILKKAGIRYFMTTKINWNEYNKFPNDLMFWKGIDGTAILTYFITTTNHKAYPELVRDENFSTTYNGRQNVSQVMGTWQRFQNKNLTKEVLTCYGYGDGGGGPTREMLEESRRMTWQLPGCPTVKQTFVREFFEGLEKNLEGKKVPTWNGELYLEYHRGTYTSMARNKKYNRQCELLNHNVELLATMALIFNSQYKYPKKELDDIWRLTLLNQFHDILPGTSIEEVYVDSQKQYEAIIEKDNELLNQAMLSMINEDNVKDTLIIYQTAGVKRDSMIKISEDEMKLLKKEGYQGTSQRLRDGGHLLYLDKLPVFGYITGKALGRQGKQGIEDDLAVFTKNKDAFILDTCFYHVSFNKKGEIVSLIDKENQRDIVTKGRILNQLIAFEDRPYEYDSWNIDAYYEEKSWNIDNLSQFELIENGPLAACIRVKRSFLHSIITQDIWFYRYKRRIDFQTTVDWKEEQILLKAAFPIDVVTDEIICDIQFGNVKRKTHRNTSWDQAKFEICAHKWVDIAEDGYGVALLNDCKYGLDAYESCVRLTLIKSGIFPNPNADKEVHNFTYSILPHSEDFRKANVIGESFDLNMPVITKILPGRPKIDEYYEAIVSDANNLVLETLKQSEDGRGIILRVYETYGRRSKVVLDLSNMGIKNVKACDLLETDQYLTEAEEDIRYYDHKLDFVIQPYELRTFYMEN